MEQSTGQGVLLCVPVWLGLSHEFVDELKSACVDDS